MFLILCEAESCLPFFNKDVLSLFSIGWAIVNSGSIKTLGSLFISTKILCIRFLSQLEQALLALLKSSLDVHQISL